MTAGRLVSCLLLSLFLIQVNAQTRRQVVRAKVDSVLQAKYNKVSYDTSYISRPKAKLTLKLRTNISGNSIHARSTRDGINTKADLKTDLKATLSLGINYQGITAGVAINPAKLKGKNKDFEMNLNAYSNKFSLDASYQLSKTFAGDEVRDGTNYHLAAGFVETKMLNVSGYYTFNHRRFSYPAAFTQTYIQKKSAGSWLIGYSYQSGRIKTTDERPENIPEARIFIGHFGIGGGYGYNLVLGKKWLFHASFLPTLVLFNLNNITVNRVRQKMHTKFPDTIMNEHVAIIHNFNEKYFAGLTVVMSSTLFGSSTVTINQNKWRARAYLGIRF